MRLLEPGRLPHAVGEAGIEDGIELVATGGRAGRSTRALLQRSTRALASPCGLLGCSTAAAGLAIRYSDCTSTTSRTCAAQPCLIPALLTLPHHCTCRSHDEQPLGADACGAASVRAQSARAHQAALACAPLRPDLATPSRGRWGLGGTGGELYQDSRQGVYVLPVQASPALPSYALGFLGGAVLFRAAGGRASACVPAPSSSTTAAASWRGCDCRGPLLAVAVPNWVPCPAAVFRFPGLRGAAHLRLDGAHFHVRGGGCECAICFMACMQRRGGCECAIRFMACMQRRPLLATMPRGSLLATCTAQLA